MAANDGRGQSRTLDPKKQTLPSQHTEKHFTAGDYHRRRIRWPYRALHAHSKTITSYIVLAAGIYEVAAAAISMGLDMYTFNSAFVQ